MRPFYVATTRLAAIGINIAIGVITRFGPIRFRLEARAEFIVVVVVLILLIHRRVGAVRLAGLLLRSRVVTGVCGSIAGSLRSTA